LVGVAATSRGRSSSASCSARASPPSAQPERQHDDVEHVEADQCRLLDGPAADQQLADGRTDPRNRRGDVGADRHRPERQLIPRQEIAGEREEQRQEEHHHAEHPVPLAVLPAPDAVLVGAGQEHPHQVQEHGDDHPVRGDAVHRPDPRSEGDDELDVLYRLVGALDRRHVEEEERQPGEDQQEEQRGRDGAEPERVGPGHRGLADLGGERVVQEVRGDRIPGLAIRSR
jgi:hypothetical protein